MVANQVSITPERQEDYDFSAPYTVSKGVVVVTRATTSISSFDDLEGKTTAQSLTSNWYKLAEESGANVEAVEGWAQAVDAAAAGPRGRDRQRQADLPGLPEHRGRRHRPRDRGRPPRTRRATRSRSARAATTWSRPSTRRSRSSARTARSPRSPRSTSAPTSRADRPPWTGSWSGPRSWPLVRGARHRHDPAGAGVVRARAGPGAGGRADAAQPDAHRRPGWRGPTSR